MPAVIAVGVGAMLVATGGAWAGGQPKLVISGAAQAGETLTAHADYKEVPATVEWQWLRCRPDKSESCATIPDATLDSYSVASADIGFRLRVRLTVVSTDGKSEDARSKPTAIVIAAPIHTPTPSPGPAPALPPPSVEQPPPPPAPPPQRTAQDRVRARLLHPFPIVRIRGRLTTTGARITLLTVRAPRGVRIVARCRGHSCPARRLAIAAAVTRLKRFERRLRAGTRLEIKITKPGYIGKWSVIRIRRGRVPRRSDRCIYPGHERPVRCPAG